MELDSLSEKTESTAGRATFVHIIESNLQDSHTVLTVMEHVLRTLKHEHPELTRVVYRQDNAGCYHCATTILACKLLRDKTKMDLCRIDFCDPQGVKGPNDRKLAQMKTRVEQYINQGHSVAKSADLKRAMRVFLERPATVNTKSIKWESISSLFNLEIKTEGVRSFKAYGIGEGNFRSWTSFAGKHASSN